MISDDYSDNYFLFCVDNFKQEISKLITEQVNSKYSEFLNNQLQNFIKIEGTGGNLWRIQDRLHFIKHNIKHSVFSSNNNADSIALYIHTNWVIPTTTDNLLFTKKWTNDYITAKEDKDLVSEFTQYTLNQHPSSYLEIFPECLHHLLYQYADTNATFKKYLTTKHPLEKKLIKTVSFPIEKKNKAIEIIKSRLLFNSLIGN